MKNKRLFLIAGYDPKNEADESLLYLVSSMAGMGDVVLYMDTECNRQQLNKFIPFTLHCDASRHREYDFGSYKRAYIWAKNNLKLSAYDFLYLINDSIYGPLKDIKPYLEKMESLGTDAFGLVCNPHKTHPHIQSWFIGCKKSVFLSKWFDDFMNDIKMLSDKGSITKQYEQGFSKKILDNGLSWKCLYTVPGRRIYNDVKKLYKHNLPFIKKASFIRHNGRLGRQILYILSNTDEKLSKVILSNAERIWGKEYIHWLLTKNPIKIIYRKITYAIKKLFKEGI